MALSIAILIIFSLIVDWMFKNIKIPGLVGMLLVGIITGPYVLGLLGPDLMKISSDMRMIALIVILLRAGFELSKDTLHKVGMRAVLLSFIPAVMEGVSVTFLGVWLLHLSLMESAILGSVLSAVSPAVVVPLMIKFIEEKRGTDKGIPTLVLAASSIDDVFVIVIYSVLIGMYTGQKVNIAIKLAGIPISIITGILVGLICGFLLYKLFDKFHPRATKRLLVILGISILLVSIEHATKNFFPFAALLAVMAIGFIILEKSQYMAHQISEKLNRLWVFAEIILFTLVGAQVNLHVALKAGLVGSVLVFTALIFRSIGTYICLIKSNLTIKERIFVVIAYIPKATVQAAIGGAPLVAMKLAGMNTQPGEIILAVAVLSILLTAPIGAWAITFSGKRLLNVSSLKGQMSESSEQDKKDILLSVTKIKDIMYKDVASIREDVKIKKVFDYFSEYDFLICPIENSNRKFIGLIKLENLRMILNEHSQWDILLAHDAMSLVDKKLRPSSVVKDGLKIADELGIDQIPVVEEGSGKTVGIFDIRTARRIIEKDLIISG